MLRFIQGTPRNFYKPTIILETPATRAFRNIGANTVRRTYDLFPYRIFCKMIPTSYNSPNHITKTLS